jgi:alpha-mannosidase
MIGNAHIDPVWLWRWQAGVDEALATFSSAADRCEEYPEFIFTRGESWVYEQVERLDPDLFERVKEHVKSGQWHVTGGQYLQPDANLPTEAGWRRQILHGQRYFEDRFGIRPNIGYNVDTFGHPATVPDLLSSLGHIAYVFHRPGDYQMDLPAQTFRWRGSGGGEILGFRIAPNYVTHADNLYGQIMISAEAADPDLGHTMCFYGVGNHGGGPTKGSIEYIIENRDAFDGLELRFSTPQQFFEEVAPHRGDLPVVEGELQHCFPGCYSVMHDIKQRQVRGEHLLDQSENIVRSFGEDGQRRLNDRIDAAWEDLLFTQFHDILAGTSIPSSWESVRSMQGRATIIGEEVSLEATRRWSRKNLPAFDHQQIVVMNPDPEPWEGLVETEPFLDFAPWGGRWLSDPDGTPVDFQRIQPEAPQMVSRVIFPSSVPAGGHEQILVRDDPAPERGETPTDLEVSPDLLANSHLRVELDAGGVSGISVADERLFGAIGLHLRQDHTDTWTFGTDRFEEPVATTLSGAEWVVEEEGPLRGRVRLEARLGLSSIRWTLDLHRNDPRLRMKLEVSFNEKFEMLQMPIELSQPSERWLGGSGTGWAERAAGATEWPVQGWSLVESGGNDLAVVTHDAYSASMDGRVWQWTLLRSPKMAWGGEDPEVYAGRDWHTDQGQHTFDFTICAENDLDTQKLNKLARQQAQPPVVFDRYEGLDRPPWGNSPPRLLWLASEQRAVEDGQMPDL